MHGSRAREAKDCVIIWIASPSQTRLENLRYTVPSTPHRAPRDPPPSVMNVERRRARTMVDAPPLIARCLLVRMTHKGSQAPTYAMADAPKSFRVK